MFLYLIHIRANNLINCNSDSLVSLTSVEYRRPLFSLTWQTFYKELFASLLAVLNPTHK
jgi:hypothetical protein